MLTRDRTAKALALLAAEPAELSARRHAIKPERARILPAGAVIVDAILRRYRVDYTLAGLVGRDSAAHTDNYPCHGLIVPAGAQTGSEEAP